MVFLLISNPVAAMTPEEVVQQNLDYYNERNLDGFMSLLSQDVALFNQGDKEPSLSGWDQLRTFYQALFEKSPALHSTIHQRIVIGNTVIDHERIVGRNGSDTPVELVLIYEVQGDRIFRITVIRES